MRKPTIDKDFINQLLNDAEENFKKARRPKMNQNDYKDLYIIYKDKIEAYYIEGKKAIDDGFDFKDLEVFKNILVRLNAMIDDFQEDLTLDEKKEFVVYFVMEMYKHYSAKLPWWYSFIPFKAYFIKKYVKKYVGELMDFLHGQGFMEKPE